MLEQDLHPEGWIPTTDAEQQAIRGQLERMLESSLFRNSKRYPSLLRYLVEQALVGNEAQLKERTLGVTVFHRAPDYDTNQDTVVRLTASEVRKRIAQYYHQPEHAGELQIDLRPGSYVPVFRLPETASVPVHSGDHPVPAPEETQSALNGGVGVTTPKPARAAVRRPMRWLAAASALPVVLAAAAFWWSSAQAARSADQQLWTPILREPGQVRLVLADLSATLSDSRDLPAGQAAAFVEQLRMGEMVNYRDTLAQTGIVAFLAQHNKSYALELSTQASYPDLQRGASVLVGGLDNVWTMRVTEPLRYHFVRRGSSFVYAIEDRVHPELGGWDLDMAQMPDRGTEDFALVARVFDQTTGRPVLVVAGLGANGTNAAAQFLLDPARTAELTAHAPRDWQHLNMEAVLRTQIIDNHAGPPHLVACTFW